MTDLSGLTLQFDMEILPVNSEEGNVRPDGVRYASVGSEKLTITTGAGDIYEVPLMSHAQIVSGDYTPGSFGFSLHDRDAATLDELLVGTHTPTLTDKAYVYFMSTRWSCSSAEAIAYCILETRLLNNIGAPNIPSWGTTTSQSTSAAPTTRSSRSWPLVPAHSRRISPGR